MRASNKLVWSRWLVAGLFLPLVGCFLIPAAEDDGRDTFAGVAVVQMRTKAITGEAALAELRGPSWLSLGQIASLHARWLRPLRDGSVARGDLRLTTTRSFLVFGAPLTVDATYSEELSPGAAPTEYVGSGRVAIGHRDGVPLAAFEVTVRAQGPADLFAPREIRLRGAFAAQTKWFWSMGILGYDVWDGPFEPAWIDLEPDVDFETYLEDHPSAGAWGAETDPWGADYGYVDGDGTYYPPVGVDGDPSSNQGAWGDWSSDTSGSDWGGDDWGGGDDSGGDW
jgi:hypothetical protein